jgi:type I restriction enzyme M protein
MDASQYKDYVLFMLFIKYISDKYGNSDAFAPPVIIPKGASFVDMVAVKGNSDIGNIINSQVIQPLIEANDRLARSDFPDFNDPNKLGQGKDMVDRLTNLIGIFEKPELDFSQNRAENDDILGDAYEYLMRHFATQSGKSKGQFYTPAEVSRIMAQVLGIGPHNAKASTTAYDPTCGSGSLLLKVAAQAGTQITLEGQEMDVTTAGLARMNMILHDFPTASIQQGNTLASPWFKDGEQLRTYDYVVANPPFSTKTWSNGLTPERDKYQRFGWGVPPTKQGDYAFLLHIIRSMKSTGKAACILPHGVLFRGNAEAQIRRNLVQSGILKGIIGLPANLFYGTGIPACILILDKENATARKGIFMIDASKGFIKDGAKNRLREQDIHRIVDTFNRQMEVPRYARMVPFDEIDSPKNEYNLNLPRYIDSSELEDLQDIEGHLRGGIPERDVDAFSDYWHVMPTVREMLFKPLRLGYVELKLPIGEVKVAILGHSEFAGFKRMVNLRFDEWSTKTAQILRSFDKDGHPKELIHQIAENLLVTFHGTPLLDAYDMYQHLMDFWAGTMQDDCYLIAADGWVSKTDRVIEEVKSGKKKGEKKDKGWACYLIPKQYIVARYFAKEQADLDAFHNQLDVVNANLIELAEEHGGEEGVLKDVSTKGDAQEAYTQALVALWNEEDKVASQAYGTLMVQAEEFSKQIRDLIDHHFIYVLKNNKGNLTLKAVKDRLSTTSDPKEGAILTSYIEADKEQKAAIKQASELLAKIEVYYQNRLNTDPLPENLVDLQATVRYLSLLDEQSALKGEVKEADAALDKLAYEKYPQLSVHEIKALVVDDKWLTALTNAVQGELDRVSQTLTTRIRQLAERYETPLPKLVDEVTGLSARVDEHLKRMGAKWN